MRKWTNKHINKEIIQEADKPKNKKTRPLLFACFCVFVWILLFFVGFGDCLLSSPVFPLLKWPLFWDICCLYLYPTYTHTKRLSRSDQFLLAFLCSFWSQNRGGHFTYLPFCLFVCPFFIIYTETFFDYHTQSPKLRGDVVACYCCVCVCVCGPHSL